MIGFPTTRCCVAALLASGLLACTPAHGPAPDLPLDPEPVRVMTFNIRYGTAPDGDHAWPLRRDLAFEVIRDCDPTVLGLQEALRFQLDEIRDALPHFGEVGVGRDDGSQQGEYSALLYDRRRLQLLEGDTFWLSDTPEVPGSMSWGNRFVRIVTWARFRDRLDGATFYAFNTHWDHDSQPARERSAALLLDRIRTRTHLGDPVLLLGDFNAGEENSAFRALLDASFHDTFRAVHPHARDTGTYHAFRGDRHGDKIDAILASPEWQTLQAHIVHREQAGIFPSDHFPVTATVRLTTAPSPHDASWPHSSAGLFSSSRS